VSSVDDVKPAECESRHLSPAEESALKELFLRGVAELGMPAEVTAESLVTILRAGLDASHGFAQEMIEGRTERAQLAREALTAEVYGRCVLNEARQSFLRRAEQRANYNNMVKLRDELGL
jgi:hypothetical protein